MAKKDLAGPKGDKSKMKNWLMAIVGGIIIGVAIWLIVVFAPQVLVFLEGIVGIAAGIVGGVILAIGASGVKNGIREKKQRKPTAEADPEESNN